MNEESRVWKICLSVILTSIATDESYGMLIDEGRGILFGATRGRRTLLLGREVLHAYSNEAGAGGRLHAYPVDSIFFVFWFNSRDPHSLEWCIVTEEEIDEMQRMEENEVESLH